MAIWFTIDQLGQQKYFLAVVFAVILVASDLGGDLWSRLRGMLRRRSWDLWKPLT
jgi:hypothetical protein